MPVMMVPARPTTARLIHFAVQTGMLVLLALSASSSFAFAQEREDAGMQLERFIRYVRWPNEAGVQHPWRLCVVGDATAATQHFAGIRARNREILLIVPRDPSETAGCHLLDLRQADPGDLGAWLDAARSRPVLTVGRDASFCSRGGHICFSQDSLPPFEINLSATQTAGLRISARLLAREPYETPPP